ncbi:MAG: hypothetical protein JKX70_02705 [Phycisphaerales bacterium]|nr:hypothetical protein [Phycisphaerales bacterium]
MPKKAIGTQIVQALPTIVLIAMVVALSMPVVIEMVRTLPGASLDETLIGQGKMLLLVRSLAIAGLIGLVGVCMGVPIGRVIHAKIGEHRFLIAVLISPIWLPAMMVYAAGNLMRAPDTILGHALISYSTSSPDLRWMTIWAGYAIAVIGLAIWSAPIAGLLIASGMGHRSNLYAEMIALEPVGIVRRSMIWVRMNIGVLVRAWILLTVLMLGSAVPMHLAQLETWSIVIWRQLAQSPIDQWGAVWVSAWPMVLVACIGAWVLTGSLIHKEDTPRLEDHGHSTQRVPKLVIVSAMVIWAMGALVPMIAMLITLDDWSAIPHFWRMQSSAMQDSGFLALVTGFATMMIALLVAMTLGNPSIAIRRLGVGSVFALCILGLIPGVLIGAAVARSGALGGWWGALLASCIRAGFLGAIIGAMCASSESLERKSIRWQMGGGSIRAWVLAVLPRISMPILGSGLIGGLYSMYEIEASVMVRPPGMDNLPQQLLSDLHYARLEQLSAAGINLLAIGLVCSVVASMLVSRIQTER